MPLFRIPMFREIIAVESNTREIEADDLDAAITKARTEVEALELPLLLSRDEMVEAREWQVDHDYAKEVSDA